MKIEEYRFGRPYNLTIMVKESGIQEHYYVDLMVICIDVAIVGLFIQSLQKQKYIVENEETIERQKRRCDTLNSELPEYKISERGVMVKCKPCPQYMELLNMDTQIKPILGQAEQAGQVQCIIPVLKSFLQTFWLLLGK